MAKKPDFMKAVLSVGDAMNEAAGRTTGPAIPENPPVPPQPGKGSETGAPSAASARTAKVRTSTRPEKVAATIYMERNLYQRMKVMAAMEDRRVNDYFLEALDDYLAKIQHRLPKL